MDKILNNLGLCNRARGLITGEEFVCDGMANKTVKYVFLASDASANAKKKIYNKANYYNVVLDNSFTSEEISKAIGKNNRMVVGITDIGFAKKIKEIR